MVKNDVDYNLKELNAERNRQETELMRLKFRYENEAARVEVQKEQILEDKVYTD